MSGYSAALTRLEPAMIPLLVLLVIPACMFVSKEDLPGRAHTAESAEGEGEGEGEGGGEGGGDPVHADAARSGSGLNDERYPPTKVQR